MKLHNTMSRATEEFQPVNPDTVSLYTCGPTVYDFAHIGNLRSFVFDDLLRRTLSAAGYDVKHVMNITDVGHLSSDADEGDDKLEAGAKREQKSVWEVADFYIDSFQKDVNALNILPPNGYHSDKGIYARATDFIDQQIDIVKILLDKGYAYITEQAIYFDVTKLDDYGKLTGQKLADKEVAVRQEVYQDSHKRHPADFALWFFKIGRFADHSMAWSSPWGEGFPGWHLECSAIIHALFKEPIDIHTGGVDHIGTHHTNEIAQSEAAFGVNLANYWLHNEHLLVDDEKMSKSKGNYYTLADVIKKGYSPMDLRLLFLQSHYRSQASFSWQSLEAAQTVLKRYYAWADLIHQRDAEPAPALKMIDAVQAALEDDLNSPKALAIFNEYIDKVDPTAEALQRLDDLFGLNFSGRADISEQQKQTLASRQTARQQQDWQRSDKLRDELLEQGIEVDDTPAGQIWKRI